MRTERDAASGTGTAGTGSGEERLRALALRLARACRRVVQGCLREEEWRDADEEFCRVILVGLREAVDGSGHRNQV
ncbi:MAG TPA: hypothetical protein VG826_18730 [Pirellulales bacterium]|nr:hypothetical protein [Pirellulales bacterium]